MPEVSYHSMREAEIEREIQRQSEDTTSQRIDDNLERREKEKTLRAKALQRPRSYWKRILKNEGEIIP